MTTATAIPRAEPRRAQKLGFHTGNEMAALAAKQINFHMMGYYPITPSTEIAEFLDEMKAEGRHAISMVPADGEHPAAGLCYGASIGGGRVLNATSSQGLLYALEQLPAQAGTRFPMVLDLVTRSVNAPLDIRGDHSDLYFALQTGWLILMARDPQAVYDMNMVGIRLAEHPDVRLPVLVAFDGFFTSHQKRRVEYFEEDGDVQAFLGPCQTPIDALDPHNPITIGPYMNDPDLINNKYQLKLAMDAARRVLPDVLEEYASVTGRRYPVVDAYRMKDAEAAILLLNSAADTAKGAADRLREEGYRVGVVSPNVLRPFPAAEIRGLCGSLKALLVAERADAYGANGGPITHEVKSTLQEDHDNHTLCLSRVYGLGGKDFYPEDAESLFHSALEAAERGAVEVPFDYHGVTPGDPRERPARVQEPLTDREARPGLVRVTRDGDSGELTVNVPPPWQLAARAKRFAPGHGACPGCGIFPALNQFFAALEGHVVVLYQTGCAQVTTTGYPFSAHRVTYIHNLFQNGASTLGGLVEMFEERQRRGELPEGRDITFVMISGDGGMDIGMGSAIGSAVRNHRMIILEYDNEGYMNTGSQLSYSTPYGHSTSTSHAGPEAFGKPFHHKDNLQIMAACNVPYVFSAAEAFPDDLFRKGAKAQWHASNDGMAYGKMLIGCPLNWRTEDRVGVEVVQAAVDSCVFPLYEVENGHTRITYDPDEVEQRTTLRAWLESMGKTRHLLRPEWSAQLDEAEAEIDRRWQRLKAMHEHPLL